MKGLRWMPWRQEPMKDASGCEKLRGVAERALIRRCPNGETRLGSCPVPRVLRHRASGGNRPKSNISVGRGMESNRDSPSSGERTGISLNRGGVKSDSVAVPVSWDLHAPPSEGAQSHKTDV